MPTMKINGMNLEQHSDYLRKKHEHKKLQKNSLRLCDDGKTRYVLSPCTFEEALEAEIRGHALIHQLFEATKKYVHDVQASKNGVKGDL